MKTECLAEDLCSDIISTLPETIIETILCFLPIKEAARTCILSTQWRYKWTRIPKLVFDSCSVCEITTEAKQLCDIKNARKDMDERCKFFYVIHQVLLMRQGPINEFSLSINACNNYFEVDQILLHLSRNHSVKKLSLGMALYKFPSCAFSLHQLTDLCLESICIDHQPTFGGFGSLRSLYMLSVDISTKALLSLLSNCPSLTSFDLRTDIDDKYCTINELFECLPVIEHLTIWSEVESWIVLDLIPEDLPTLLIHLKYFHFVDMCLADNHGLAFLVALIKCSPNLERIKLELETEHTCCENGISSTISRKYSNVWLEHLLELNMSCFHNFEPEMEFVKFILARSPKLKKITISSVVETDKEELEMAKILLRAPRASPVEIVIGKTIAKIF